MNWTGHSAKQEDSATIWDKHHNGEINSCDLEQTRKNRGAHAITRCWVLEGIFLIKTGRKWNWIVAISTGCSKFGVKPGIGFMWNYTKYSNDNKFCLYVIRYLF